MNSKLIAIEGLDGVGKNTQSKMLVEYLEKTYGSTVMYSFPRYNTKTGSRVADYLNDSEEFKDYTLLQRAALYADDRLAAREEIIDNLSRGTNVVCDRYVFSNTYFVAMAALEHEDNQASAEYPALIRKHILFREFGTNKLPVPDLTMVLQLPVETTVQMVLGKEKREYTDKKQDKHERDIRLLRKVGELYAQASQYPNTIGIDCYNGSDGPLSIMEISRMVKNQVDKLMQREHSNIFTYLDSWAEEFNNSTRQESI